LRWINEMKALGKEKHGSGENCQNGKVQEKDNNNDECLIIFVFVKSWFVHGNTNC
jgi:hypothetical protein